MSIEATYVSADVFTVETDLTSEFHAGRKVKANCGVDGYIYKTIVSSDSTGITTITCEDDGQTLTSNLTEVWYGIVGVGIGQSLPDHDHTDSGQGGTIDHTELISLDTANYSHLTAAQKTDLTDGDATTLHKHDHVLLDNLNSTTHQHITLAQHNQLIQPGYTAIHSHDYLSGYQGKYVLGQTEGSYEQDPNDISFPYILTKHANCPGGDVRFWWIRTTFWDSMTSTSERAQIAIKYSGVVNMEAFVRNYVTSWSEWIRIDQAEAGVKAWINFNGTGTIAERDSFNVTSITDLDTGQYTVTWDVDFQNVNYAVAGCAGRNGDGDLTVGMKDYSVTPPTAGTFHVEIRNNAGTAVDPQYVLLIASGIH